jgi:hypothetical protein
MTERRRARDMLELSLACYARAELAERQGRLATAARLYEEAALYAQMPEAVAMLTARAQAARKREGAS